MGLDISEDKEWMNRYIRLWNEIQELLFARLEIFTKNDAYIILSCFLKTRMSNRSKKGSDLKFLIDGVKSNSWKIV